MSDTDNELPNYLNKLTQTPLLTAEEEVVLTQQAQAGDEDARNRLIESNMRLVISVAKTYRSPAISLEDFVQEGTIGLIQAIEKYDPDKGFRFSTYATHWIRQSIGRAMDNKSKGIRLPAHISQSLRRMDKAKKELYGSLGHEPSMEEIARYMQIPLKRLSKLIQSAQELLSLDNPASSGEDSTIGSMVLSEDVNPIEHVISGEESSELYDLIAKLNSREQSVIKYRFGMAEDVDISKSTKERIRQIEICAIKKLRALAGTGV